MVTVRPMSFHTKFTSLGHPNRIFAVSAVHGEADRLRIIHQKVFDRFSPGDRIVYTGNYFAGSRAQPMETMDDLLRFRRSLLAQPGVMPGDFVYLRGIQEELWRNLLRLQMSLNAGDTVNWIIKNHPEMDSLLRVYNSSLEEATRVAREGVMNLTRWAATLQNSQRQHPGHEKFFTVLRRAAFTENKHSNDNNLLFVHAGIDPQKPLTDQEDQFWWASKNFNSHPDSFRPFRAVIRGYDPEHQGMHVGQAFISIDSGCGYGGKLTCAEMTASGDIRELISA